MTARLIDVYPYRINESGGCEFLILKRSPNKLYAGQWRMVGGKVKEGERAWEAGLRELREETSADPVNFWSLPSLNHFYDPNTDDIELIPAFAAELSSQQEIVLNVEHTEYKWIESKESERLIVWPEQCRLISLAQSILTADNILEDWKISF